MYEVYESEKKDDLFKVKPILEELLLNYVSEKKMNTLKHFVNTSLIFLMSRNPTRDWDLLIFLRDIGDYTHSLIQRMFQNIALSNICHLGTCSMERLGISLDGLKSGSVPTISNLPNDLVLDLFKVVKSKKELKTEALFNWLQKNCGKSLNRTSIISKVYTLLK